MTIKQINKSEIEVTIKISDIKTRKIYILIDSEEGVELIKKHKIVIDKNMKEF